MNYQFIDGTICAPATIPGTGAISIIRVSGKEALTIADRIIRVTGTPISETEGYRLRYGTVFEPDGTVLDNVVTSVFRAPHSYTGEDSVEISCHASKFIVNAILQQLVAAGARIAAPGEFTRRAFMNGKMDLAQAEAVADVIASQSAASHRVAMNQLKGGFSRELKTLRDKLLKMTSLLELELDFSEEDVEFASREELAALVTEALTHIGRLTDSFRRGNAIRNGVPVAIVGATNTGKSTLLNALLGEDRAIVSDIAGTTRDTIEETLDVGGVMFRFIDTAGIRETDEVVERIGIERTFKMLDAASVVLGMTDLSRSADSVLADAEYIRGKVGSGQSMILLLNKCDAAGGVNAGKMVSAIRGEGIDAEVIPISAKSGEGLPVLLEKLGEIGRRLAGATDETLVTNARHYEALVNAAAALQRVRTGLGVPDDGSASPVMDNCHRQPVMDEAARCIPEGRMQSDHAASVHSHVPQMLPPDLVAQDLREALYHLGSIVGEITTDEVLGNIFKNFCIGK